jgi:DNA-binding CsgD family transcriptional regulator
MAPSPSLFQTSLVIAATFYLSAGPIILLALLDFSGLRGKRALLIILPAVIETLMQLTQVWTGTWVIVGFHPTAWGNVNDVSHEPFALAVRSVGSVINAAIGLSALVYAWFHSQSKQYRSIAIKIFFLSLLVNLWGIFAAKVVWLSWDMPDPTGLGAGFVLIGYTYLIERYQHLTERRPDMTGPLLASLKGTALFINTQGIVVKAPEEAVRLLGDKLEGRSIFEILPDCTSLSWNWAALKVDLLPKSDLPASIAKGAYSIQLLPHRNPFDEFDGALVRIVPEGSFDETTKRYSLSSREQDVAKLVCEGFDTRQIAEALFISQATVKNHLHNLYEKTETSGRADLVRVFLTKDHRGETV